MARGAVVWAEGGRLRWAELQESRDTIISRSPDADIQIADPAVSRSPHAAIRVDSGRFVLQQIRSDRRPLCVNGAPVQAPTPLTDGDRLEVGSVSLVLHDLSTGDTRSSYVICTTCGHRNDAHRTECWYDGENLANAQSAIYQVSRILCRALVSGKAYDLREGDVLSIEPDGSIHAEPNEGTSAVQIRVEGGVWLQCDSDTACRVNQQAASGRQPIRTGDLVEVGPTAVLMMVR